MKKLTSKIEKNKIEKREIKKKSKTMKKEYKILFFLNILNLEYLLIDQLCIQYGSSCRTSDSIVSNKNIF